MKESREGNRNERDSSTEITQVRTYSKDPMATSAIDHRRAQPPQCERPAVRQMRERCKHKRNLRGIQRKIADARHVRHALRCDGGLSVHVVQLATSVRNREGPQRIEM